MNVALFPFQQRACRALRSNIALASDEYCRGGTPQVLSFTAPTGAGKTIIVASLIEDIFCGVDGYPEQRNAIVVWLSDAPQLNEQSKIKIETKADRIVLGQCVTIDETFVAEQFADGHIYFLNTQKLGRNANLTKHSDMRQYTIWQTLANTVRHKSDRLYVVIDEAHRGAQGRAAAEATTIMQKFIKGSPQDGLPPMPLVLGMSATTQRFNALVDETTSTVRKCTVTADEVRSSGLLKERIIITYPESGAAGGEMAVLMAAADEWKSKCVHWEQYCRAQQCQQVCPVFVVQVLNGDNSVVSRTDLAVCLRTIAERTGERFAAGEVVHTFGENRETLTANGIEVRYVEPSQIADDVNIKVVFFKESLSTGWDCPRAETMMSFRRATDSTYIAQLLGRMVRTPLQRRITGDESLNDVYLYLPHFDEETVAHVVGDLQNTEGGNIAEVVADVVGGLAVETWAAHTDYAKIWEHINALGLPSYEVRQGRTDSYLKSLCRLTHLLAQQGMYATANKDVHNDITDRIYIYAQGLKDEGQYAALAERVQQFELHTQVIDVFGRSVGSPSARRLYAVADDDIERQFHVADKKLGNDGIGNSYGNRYGDVQKPNEFMTDVILFAAAASNLERVEQYAKEKFHTLANEYRPRFAASDERTRQQFHDIVAAGDEVSEHSFYIPAQVRMKCPADGKQYRDHLLVNPATGVARITLGTWEEATLREEQQRAGFVCWLRNPSRAKWALCIPYDYNGEKRAAYPDLLVVRRVDERYVVDIFEPHQPTLDDNLGKARGFAEYARHNLCVGRFHLIREMTDAIGRARLRRLDLSQQEVCEKVVRATTVEELNHLFDTDGFYDDGV